jgi:hypothetical protein
VQEGASKQGDHLFLQLTDAKVVGCRASQGKNQADAARLHLEALHIRQDRFDRIITLKMSSS